MGSKKKVEKTEKNTDVVYTVETFKLLTYNFEINENQCAKLSR